MKLYKYTIHVEVEKIGRKNFFKALHFKNDD